jgi:hypothetical protein
MAENISAEELKKLPLEKRAQVVLRNYFYSKVKIEGKESLIPSQPYMQEWDYLENNAYIMWVGGTSESGNSYKITLSGLEFMDEAI